MFEDHALGTPPLSERHVALCRHTDWPIEEHLRRLDWVRLVFAILSYACLFAIGVGAALQLWVPCVFSDLEATQFLFGAIQIPIASECEGWPLHSVELELLISCVLLLLVASLS
jgi:hypothetical protein